MRMEELYIRERELKEYHQRSVRRYISRVQDERMIGKSNEGRTGKRRPAMWLGLLFRIRKP